MKILTLSDHTAGKAAEAAAKRESEYADATETYRKALEAKKTRKQQLRAEISIAWSYQNIWATLIGLWRFALAYLSSNPYAPTRQSAGREEIVWNSGNEGERRVSDFIAQRLADEWTLVSGYRNSKGEIDQVLVGPRGVFAIEIKYVNGVVYCDGDRWWRDKYDRYGNIVETNLPIQDKRGRGPSRQLNDSADMLQSFLSKRVGLSRVHRAIVLSHESSKLGDMTNVAVDYVANMDNFDLNQFFGSSSISLDSAATDRIIQAIRKDHDFHDKPRMPKG